MPNYAGLNLVSIGLQAEHEVANILREHGHKVMGRTPGAYDLLCDGKVRIEVKVAYEKDGQCIWAFNSRKPFQQHCDVIILVAKSPNGSNYYIIPSNHKILFTSEGSPKAGIGIFPSTASPKRTGLILRQHLNRWGLLNNIAKNINSSPVFKHNTTQRKTILMRAMERRYNTDIIQLLTDLYYKLGTQAALAGELSVSPSTICRWAWRLGIMFENQPRVTHIEPAQGNDTAR